MTDVLSYLSAQGLLREFNETLGVEFEAPPDLMSAAESAIEGCRHWRIGDKKTRTRALIARVNAKLKLNKLRFQEFLDAAARLRVFLNYHDKTELAECLDSGDKQRLETWLAEAGYEAALSAHFNPVSTIESLMGLRELLSTGKVNRSDARICDLSERQTEILRSLFGSYIFDAFPAQAMHSHFNSDCKASYSSDFYKHLLRFHPKILHRDCALVYLTVDRNLVNKLDSTDLRDLLYEFIKKTYDRLANHCYLAIKICPFSEGNENGQWRLFSDLVLYAEKHREVKLQTGYFRPSEIEAATTAHIPSLKLGEGRFEIANEGFFFKDCIVLAPKDARAPGGEAMPTGMHLLLLFEKNERDENIVPCPACRSFDVRGNSYPVLGVKSWECQNPLCPDRSAFDRGNRYSLSAIIKQEAIKSKDDQIPEESLRRWKLDVVFGTNEESIVDMLTRHFSLHGDRLVFVNATPPNIEGKFGRSILHETLDSKGIEHGLHKRFQNSAFFKRFVIDREPSSESNFVEIDHKVKAATLYHGDCFNVLFELQESIVCGAVTSPPYYNARSYTTWPNIYCYLYDMYNAARAVYRALVPGGIYIFNIFDYFDNENSVVLSAMGKKRMILGPYMINLFSRIGFELQDNVVWYKGEIEGKRNFNQGNRSPYYQFPLNCWEHCLIFRKPNGTSSTYSFAPILDAKPVFKMVRGENILGHTAPFPVTIPRMLVSQMAKDECVLDPFSGSMTTGRLAHRQGLRSISIEMHKHYCELGARLLEEEDREGADLFLRAS